MIPLIYILLAVAVIATFQRVSQCDFISYDDREYLTENPNIRNGVTIEAIRWAFTTGYAANWHPLTWISHMLDVRIFGLNPHWHHLVNLLFHIANTLLLFFLFYKMTKEPWKCGFVAAMFAVHPLHVESVAWVAERKDVLSTFFWMLTMAAYIRYVERLRVKNYLYILVFFGLGLMAKPMLVTLPFVLLLLDYWPLKRFGPYLRPSEMADPEHAAQATPQVSRGGPNENIYPTAKRRKSARKPIPAPSPAQASQGVMTQGKMEGWRSRWALVRQSVREKIPLFALATLSCIATFIAQQKGGAVQSTELFSPGARIANALVSYVLYIAKTIWPVDLAVLYPHPGMPPAWQWFGAALFLMAVTFIVIRQAAKQPYLAFGWLWFAGTLVPVIGVVQVGAQAMADRYTYIPLIGLFVMAAWGMPELLAERRYRKQALFASSALILVCLSVSAWVQTGYWRDSLSLYDHTLKVTSRNQVTYYNRAEVYQRLGDLGQAISDYDKTIAINSRYVDAYNNRGVAYRKLGNVRQAISDYNKAIEIDPANASAFYNRGFAYAMLGDYGQAIEDYRKAVEVNPGIAETHYNLGLAYGQLGDYRKAIESYSRAIEINNEYASAYNNRGLARREIGEWGLAIEDFKKAAGLNNQNAKNFLKGLGLNW
jgi:tetratricopeptide (TPR) repeat protein